MAANITSSKITLSCPLFAADFDPRNNGFLVVGGGGGEGRSGVGNKISLLDVSRRKKISEVVDINLSRDEDSVTSLGISQSSDDSIVALAGINSSQAEQQKDKNLHLRSFRIDYPPRKTVSTSTGTEEEGEEKEAEEEAEADTGDDKKREAKTTALSQVSLFNSQLSKDKKQKETYQRILRFSPWKEEGLPRIGAIATGFAPRGEIIFFNASSPTPQKSDVLWRVTLGSGEEAEDVDMIETKEEGKFKAAYTDGTSVYVSTLSTSTKSSETAHSVYTVGEKTQKKNKIRSLRFISPNTLVLLQNYPGRAGCELVVVLFRDHGSQPSATRSRRLRRSMKIGLALDVCHMPESSKGEKQCVIAVAGSDSSIELRTLNYSNKKRPARLYRYATLKDVHPFSMTKISFSTFIPPALPVTADVKPQYIKLASVSIGNTVVVHTLPLLPYPGTSKFPRYVLVTPGASEATQTILSCIVAIAVVAFGAFFLQAFTEIRGGIPPTLGATDWLSPRLHSMLARPYMFENSERAIRTTPSPSSDIPPVQTPSQSLADLISSVKSRVESDTPPEQPTETILVQELGAEILAQPIVVPETSDLPPTTKWEDLSEEKREAWKQKLIDTGHWEFDEGEAMLRGVLFGELAAFVGGAV